MRKVLSLFAATVCLAALALLSGCQTNADKSRTGAVASFSIHDGWALQPLVNEALTATASEAAGALLETHLLRRQLLQGKQPAGSQRYSVQGTVTRWHYTGIVSARPVVAVQVELYDLYTDSLVWSGDTRKTGTRRQTLTALGDQLLGELVDQLPLNSRTDTPQLQVTSATVQSMSVNPTGSAVATVAGGLGLRTQSIGGFDRVVSTPVPLQGRSTAFYYAANPPVDVLSQFDRLVLEPDNIQAGQLSQLKSRGARTYAYLSVGEVGVHRAYAQDVQRDWVLGKNPAWNSSVLDLSNSALRAFLLERVRQLVADGYQGLFLDTMDSFNLVSDTDEQRSIQRAGLVRLIDDIAAQFPGVLLITNRGFEVLDQIAPHVEAVAAESLYASWDNAAERYSSVSPGDRDWLLGKLVHAQQNLDLDVIAIDYVPPERRADARDVAARIAAHGFVPWVANPALDYVGIGALEVLPRKVLMLYDSRVDGALELSPVHKFVATPVEYMGYVPEYLDVATEPLPAGELKGRYAGIVTWAGRVFQEISARPWIQKQLDDQVPMAFMALPPVAFDDDMLSALGVQLSQAIDVESAQLVHSDDFIQPERSLSRRIESFGYGVQSVSSANTVHMSYRDSAANQTDVVVTGPFGGFAWQPGAVDDGLDYETYWVVDPFRFLRRALQLPDAPMPDVTTQNGKRLWLAHIDGDALPSWAEMPGKQLGAEVIYDQILKPYQLPHTISVVEGEMTDPAFADRRMRMVDIARKTFELDFVELASHTYSHPFKWSLLKDYRMPGKYNLNIPRYVYSPERETAGSIGFIDRELAPDGKRTELMLWSGDALPNKEDLAVLDRLGIPNMNGGLTNVTQASKSMTLVSPMARPVGDYLQVYAPIMNENMYTNDWTGPFDGFKRVVETFELTETPRRLKPLNIYYHFYSGTKIAAMKALTRVYDWTLKQDIHPVFGSDFAIKVPDYRQAGVARYLDGAWKLSALGNVRSIRMLDGRRWPDMTRSKGIVGATALHDGVYVHTNGADEVTFKTRSKAPAQVHLVSSNGQILRWDNTGSGLKFRIAGEVPVSLELGGSVVTACTLNAGGRAVQGVTTATGTITFTFTSKDTGNASLNCPA